MPVTGAADGERFEGAAEVLRVGLVDGRAHRRMRIVGDDGVQPAEASVYFRGDPGGVGRGEGFGSGMAGPEGFAIHRIGKCAVVADDGHLLPQEAGDDGTADEVADMGDEGDGFLLHGVSFSASINPEPEAASRRNRPGRRTFRGNGRVRSCEVEGRDGFSDRRR
jgi:hypothetical protein